MRNREPWRLTAGLLALLLAVPVWGFVGFVTVAPRRSQRATVYNAADLTLVRDTRAVVFSRGSNALRFSWANTLIDPTSFVLFPPAGVTARSTQFQLDQKDTLSWTLDAAEQTSGVLGVQYFMAGVTWRADHALLIQPDGRANLQTWVTVTNGSGEDLEDTQFRLVVGQVRLTEQIRAIAERFHGELTQYQKRTVIDFADDTIEGELTKPDGAYVVDRKRFKESASRLGEEVERPKQVTRESLSELHIFSIEGTESVPTGGARAMVALQQAGLKVQDVYRCVSPRGLVAAQRVVRFNNDRANQLGQQPLPEGTLRLYRTAGAGLSLDGVGTFPYTPMGERAETPLGVTPGVTCELYVKNVTRRPVERDSLGRITGWEDISEFSLELVNGSARAATFEVRQTAPAPFEMDLPGAVKEDVNTLLLTHNLDAFAKKSWRYRVTTRRGTLVR